ncbi:MAG TPA: Hsp20/alpha crystallin family protein [Dehalococcoidia bacterium]|jgi:HSP20 family protein|nr:Hsp20/alpha crystallin family protein [Dehalococcoidia bacterium]
MHMIRCQHTHEPVSLRQAMDKLFEDSFVTPSRFLSTFSPGGTTPIDMYHTDNEVVVKAALPGVKPEEVDITITANTLTIKGENKVEKEIKREDYLYQEHRYGTFGRSVALPSGLDSDKVEASFENGILTLTIPKSEQVKPKQIKVKAKGAVEGKK